MTMRRVTGILFGFLLIASAACDRGKTGPEQKSGGKLFTFSKDGAWCWFGDPRAIYYEGKYRRTYAGWVDHEGSVWIGYYDHETRKSGSKEVHHKLMADDHNNPTLLILPDGRLLIFFAAHKMNSPLYSVRSSSPESIDAWDPSVKLPINNLSQDLYHRDWYSYPAVEGLQVETGKLYLFFRGLNHKQSLSVSTDTGKTWSEAVPLFPADTLKPSSRPYLKIASNGMDRIHLAFTDDHPGFRPENNIYYACYHEGKLVRADGSPIRDLSQLPLLHREADLVYDAAATGKTSWIWDIADDEGAPVIAYIRFENDSTHICCYARWNGQQWENHDMVNSGGWFPATPQGEEEKQKYYSGGMAIDHENPSVIYLSREIDGVFEIERWETTDYGKAWKAEALTRNSRYDNVRPFAVRNAIEGNPLQVVWMANESYIGYRDYKSSIMAYSDK